MFQKATVLVTIEGSGHQNDLVRVPTGRRMDVIKSGNAGVDISNADEGKEPPSHQQKLSAASRPNGTAAAASAACVHALSRSRGV